jgi:hypothetical protein
LNVVVLWLATVAVGAGVVPASPADVVRQQSDSIAVPPPREVVKSPGGHYSFVISVYGDSRDYKSRYSTGELHRNDGSRALWTRRLPHELRPRFVVVNDDGQVLLVDEWINVKSRRALTLIDRQNQVVAEHPYADVQTVLGVPGSQIVRLSKLGYWLQAPPRLDHAGHHALLEGGGKLLSVDMTTGALSLAPR